MKVRIIKALIIWLIKNWLREYHLAKNPPKGKRVKPITDEQYKAFVNEKEKEVAGNEQI